MGPLLSPGDGDLYWQRWLGNLVLQAHRLPHALGNETFTAPGAPWVPQEWFFSVAVAFATNHHLFFLFSLAVSALPGLILLSIYLRSGDVARAAIGVALIFCGESMLAAFGVRAQVLGWAAFAAFLFFLERRDRWYYAAFPCAIVWANLHASVALAPVVIVARIVTALVHGGKGALQGNRDLFMLPAVAIATLCTPLGVHLPVFALAFMHSPIRHFIQEWQPPGLGNASLMIGALPLAIAVAANWKATLRSGRRDAFTCLLLFGAALFAQRNVPLFAIAAGPAAAAALAARLPQLRNLNARFQRIEPAALGIIFAGVVLSAAALAPLRGREPLPVAAIATLGGDGAPHRLFCEDFTWCSIALQYPTVRVFIDGRCDAYPLRVWQEYIAVISAGKSWGNALRDRGVDTVVATNNGAFARALAANPAWRVASADRTYVVFRSE